MMWCGTSRPACALLTACVAALAQGALAAGLADHDSSLPIDVEADRLQVEQGNETARFTGNVDVKQGGMRLKADALTVFYALGDDGAGGAQSIQRLEAQGNVFITSPEETAQGDSGVYDLIGAHLVLIGDVVLTRGDNVIRGGRLDIDLETSVATMTKDEQSGDRVRGLFVPAEN